MAEKILIIVRHGNTFLPDQTPTRVGRSTDLPLVEEDRGRAIGKYLLAQGYKLDKAYAAPLKRTMQTAQLALEEMNTDLIIIPSDEFSEIDYGPDENKTEDEVLKRLGENYISKNSLSGCTDDEVKNFGKQVIKEWDQQAIVPDGWSVDVESIINTWRNFADAIKDGEAVMICSSNGIIRFAPHVLDIPYTQFCRDYDIKVATGGVSIFNFDNGKWTCKEWNTKAYKQFR